MDVRISDDIDAQARQAMDGLLAQHEAEKAALRTESEREMDRLREAVRSLEARVRDPAQAQAAAPALASLAQGDAGPAADLLRERAHGFPQPLDFPLGFGPESGLLRFVLSQQPVHRLPRLRIDVIGDAHVHLGASTPQS